MKRLATYTVTVPIKITFADSDKLSGEELFKVAIKEINKRLENGYFDVLENEIAVIDKIKHYTLAEKIREEKKWQRFVAETKGASYGI